MPERKTGRAGKPIAAARKQRPKRPGAAEAAAATLPAEVSADRVLIELARIAFADIRNYASWGPRGLTLRPAAEISEDAAAAIAEVARTGRSPRIKLHDKKAALAALARHLGLFEPRTAGDPKARVAEAARLRELVMTRIAALADPPPKSPNGDDS